MANGHPFDGLNAQQVDARIAASNLDDLADVNAATPTDQDVLTWDDGAGEWIAQAAPAGGSLALNDLTDVDTAGGSTGDVLTQQGDGSFALETPSAGGGSTDGWNALGQTLAYGSADAPTYTATCSGVDLTGTLSVGMKLRVSQSTGGTKYFFITAIAFSTNTTITLLAESGKTLANETISSPYYSIAKAPYGFPMSPLSWKVEFTDASARSQASPTQNVWYNLGTSLLAVPIGVWILDYNVVVYGSPHTSKVCEVTLSTANNSASDSDFTSAQYVVASEFLGPHGRSKTIELTSKTTYYLNARTVSTGVTSIQFGGSDTVTRIRVVCAFL